MLIDWFTVGAQILNFLILIWLLKRFLFKPIVDAIDAREEKVSAQLSDAAAKMSAAEKEQIAFQEKNAALDQSRAALMQAATEAAKAERERLLDEARRASEELGAKRQAALEKEAQSLRQSVGRRSEQAVFAIARKALGDLADANLEDRMVDVFLHRLRGLEGKAKSIMIEAAKTADDPALVRTTVPLSQPQRSKAEAAIKDVLGATIPVQFEAAPDLICGIEMELNGQKLAWSLEEYLTVLEESAIFDRAPEENGPKPKAGRPSAGPQEDPGDGRHAT